MKSIRTDRLNHAPEGDERIRTAARFQSGSSIYQSEGRVSDLAFVRRCFIEEGWREERVVFALARLGYSRRVSLALARRWMTESPRLRGKLP